MNCKLFFSSTIKMHPILEIAIGVALGMTVFIVFAWVIGMCVYVACSKNDCIASCKKLKKFKGTKSLSTTEVNTFPIGDVQKVYQPTKDETLTSVEAEAIKENQTS